MSLHASGRVHRHGLRGHDALSPKEIRAQEDEACKAGCRNARAAVETWPKYIEAMTPVAKVLGELYDKALQPDSPCRWASELHLGLGPSPLRRGL